MRNIKFVVEYDGTNYHGFQRQTEDLPTIQQILEQTLEQLTKSPVNTLGAGRTDAGVHAKGQVINFRSDCGIPVDKMPLAMNRLLPNDIVVVAAEEADESFHAQFMAKRKVYSYHIYNSRIPSAFDRLYSYHVPQKLDMVRMKEAASYIVGEHDFSAFKSARAKTKTSVRTIYRFDIDYNPPHIYLTIEGNGFLYNMVRIITGTLLYVGKGK
ncbi:MAG TPA: tRNA pseudouridine(38-40) synthase TruA, partial [Desulfobacteria bacterium]|nr:tRNA pseudouridine(38-40) synthase TruA [Desulfobacteria bacterium]